ncbi:hypothetical protein D918_08554 [Trichuris suis]|nr:hypothetical protein D918_08554 [Trichuris suis]
MSCSYLRNSFLSMTARAPSDQCGSWSATGVDKTGTQLLNTELNLLSSTFYETGRQKLHFSQSTTAVQKFV